MSSTTWPVVTCTGCGAIRPRAPQGGAVQTLLCPRPAPGAAVSGVRADPPAPGRRAVRPLLPAVADPAGDMTRLTGGLCRACRLFRWKHPLGTCPYCGRQQPIGAFGGCRSCQAANRAARALDRAQRKRRAKPVLSPADVQLLNALAGYGGARGWAPGTLLRARGALIAVLTSGHDLGQRPWDVEYLRRFLTGRHRVTLRVVEFLTDEGLARTKPRAALEQWLARRLAALPAPVAAEVRIW